MHRLGACSSPIAETKAMVSSTFQTKGSVHPSSFKQSGAYGPCRSAMCPTYAAMQGHIREFQCSSRIAGPAIAAI